MTQLTNAERKTLNNAIGLLQKHMADGASWMPYVAKRGATLTFFTSRKEQFGEIRGVTFADKVQFALDRQTAEDNDEEGVKARRIKALRDQLATLTGEPA